MFSNNDKSPEAIAADGCITVIMIFVFLLMCVASPTIAFLILAWWVLTRKIF